MNNQALHPSDAQLNEYLDAGLNADARAALAAHLDGCEDCRQRIQSLQALFATLDELPEVPLTRDLSPIVLDQIQAPAVTWRAARWAFWLQLGLAVVILALSWPVLERWLSDAPWVPIWETLTLLAEGWREAAQTGMQALGANLQQGLQVLEGSWRQPVDLAWAGSLVELWPWVIALGLFWLLVNGAILTPWGPGGARRAR